jgi:hypothetical protein
LPSRCSRLDGLALTAIHFPAVILRSLTMEKHQISNAFRQLETEIFVYTYVKDTFNQS